MTKKKWLFLILLTGIAASTRLVAINPWLIENEYTNGIYPYISATLKYLFGWLPFSIGDILYGVVMLWLLVKISRLLKKIFKKEAWIISIKAKVYPVVVALLSIYISFNLLWGLNYNRHGIKQQLQLSPAKYSVNELAEIDSLLVEKVNKSKNALIRQNKKTKSNSELFTGVQQAYAIISKQYPYLNYHVQSIKPSLWGWAGNYLGFTGYYNPFTGEAQVSTNVPAFLLPYTCCHEVAHQLGYAKENEANFVGYLAAISSTDTAFHYSAYLDLFLYTQANLRSVDSIRTKHFFKKLLPQVNEDLVLLKKFSESHKSPAGPVFKWLYSLYLKNNQQPSGLLSYDEVTGLLIAYYKKFGTI
jgi:hypothetical protein